MANRYFHIRGGREGGPFTAAQLQGLARTGSISPDDLIRPEGAQRSYPARNVVGLFPNTSAGNVPQPPSPTSVAAPQAKSVIPTPAPAPMRHAVISHAPQAVAAAASQAAKGPAASGNPSPLVALLASLVDLQRQELTRQVVRGERTAADAERRAAELIALLRAVESQLAPLLRSTGGSHLVQGGGFVAQDGVERVQHTAAANSPLFIPSPPPPPSDTGFGTALGIGAAALIVGGAGMALGRAMAPSPPPEPPQPRREEPQSPPPGIAQVTRALWSMRPRGNDNHLPTDSPSHDVPHGHSGEQELTHHDLGHDPDIPTGEPIPEGEIVDASPGYDTSPNSGLSWDDPVADAQTFASAPPDDIPMAEPMEQESGGWFGDDGDDAGTTETDTGWFGGGGDDATVETDGGLFGGEIDTGGVDAGDLDVSGLEFTDGGGFEF